MAGRPRIGRDRRCRPSSRLCGINATSGRGPSSCAGRPELGPDSLTKHRGNLLLCRLALSPVLSQSPVERREREDQPACEGPRRHAAARPRRPTSRRGHNRRLVLRTLYDFGPISRADVARSTGLTRTTVGDVVGELLDDGMVEEVGRGPVERRQGADPARASSATPGWSSAWTSASARSPAPLVNLRGEIRRVVELPVDGRNGDAALALVFRLVDELVAGDDQRRPSASASGRRASSTRGPARSAGPSTSTGRTCRSVASSRAVRPAGQRRERQPGGRARRVHVRGDGRRRRTSIAIKVGRGIGAGLVLNGSLFQGDGFGAGEIGHVAVVDDGAACRCGRFGCLETVAEHAGDRRPATEALADEPTRRWASGCAAPATLELDDVEAAVEAATRRPGRRRRGPRPGPGRSPA